MGKFEDLIEQVRSGDESALDTLQEEFGGSKLRQQAEQGSEWQKKYQENLPLIRKAKLDDLVGKLDESLQGVGFSADDFADVDPGDLNLELIQGAAKAKLEQKDAQRLAAAQDAGFETVEEYNTALETVKQKRTERKEGMEAVASGVASGSGEPGDGESDSLLDRGSKAFKEAKATGKTDDLALASGVEAIMAAQFVGGDADE